MHVLPTIVDQVLEQWWPMGRLIHFTAHYSTEDSYVYPQIADLDECNVYKGYGLDHAQDVVPLHAGLFDQSHSHPNISDFRHIFQDPIAL